MSYVNLFNETSINVDYLSTNTVLVNDGSASSPSITFISDPATGIYKSAAGEVSITSGGTQVVSINSYDSLFNNRLYIGNRLVFVGAGNSYLAQIYCDGSGNIYISAGGYNQAAYVYSNGTWQLFNPIWNNDGSVTNPMYSFSNENGLGMYRSGTNTLSFCSNSVDALDITNTRINANVQLLVPAGSYMTPSIIFNSSETTTGIYREGVNTLSIGCNGTEVIRFGPTQLQIFEALAMGSNTINCGAITSGAIGCSSLSTGPILCGNITCGTISAGVNQITCGNVNFLNTSNQMTFGNVTLNVASTSSPITYTVPNTSTNSSFIMSDTNQSITGNLGINTTVSSTEALKVYLASGLSTGIGTEIASFGTSASERIQFFDEKISSSLGPYINFIAGNASQIRSQGALQFWLNGASSSFFTLNSSSAIIGASNPGSVASSCRLQVYGTDRSVFGPHSQYITSADSYPLYQSINYSHDQIYSVYDAYWDGSWKSSYSTSNYLISKTLDIFSLNYYPGAAQGTAIPNITSLSNRALSINTSGQVCLGPAPTSIGAHKLMIYGTANSSSTSAGAHFQIVTSTDNYPIYHIAGINHDNINLTFDGYYDGTTYRSSSTNGVFQITKASDQLRFITSSGGTQGTVPTLSVAGYFDVSGNFTCNNTILIGGNISSTGQPCLIVSASSYISVLNITNTAFNGFDTTVFSQGSITFSSNSTATIPTTGTYMICFEMQFDSVTTGTGTFNSMWIVKNSTNPPTFGMQLQQVCVNSQMYLSSSTIMRLTANDTIQVYVYQNSGGSLHVGSLGSGTARLELAKMF